MKSRAITLTEILVVIAIIGLVMMLLLPVFMGTKKQSKTVPCTSNLRQLYAAIALYQQSYDDAFPPSLVELATSSNAVTPVLSCPGDWTGGANDAATATIGIKTSYFYWPNNTSFREALMQADPNHGIAYCVMHGERLASPSDFAAQRDTTGLVLRLRQDGSVQRAQVGHWCGPESSSGRMEGRQTWSLLSDAHCVEPHCRGLTEPCRLTKN